MYSSRPRNVLTQWTIVLATLDHAWAQQTTISPPVYEQGSSSSSSYSFYPGGYADQRIQLADNTGYARLSLGSVPFDPSLVGFQIHAQSGWWDSVNNQLHLTNSASASVQPIPSPQGWNSLLITTTTQTDPLISSSGLMTQRGIPFVRYNWS